MSKKRNGRVGGYPTRRLDAQTMMLWLVVAALTAYTAVAIFFIDAKGQNLAKGALKALSDFGRMFFQPRVNLASLPELLAEMGLTLSLAMLTTMVGAVLALALGLLGARNLSGPRAHRAIKGFVAVIRAIPTELWVLIFAIGAGLGSTAAVVGMAFHTLGYLIKAYSEAFEEIDPGVIESLRASGADWFQIVGQAVLPSSLAYLISWTFVRLEINYAVAVTMGAAAGAGGIGFELFMASSFYFNIHRVGVVTWLIFLVALILEILADWLNRRVRGAAA